MSGRPDLAGGLVLAAGGIISVTEAVEKQKVNVPRVVATVVAAAVTYGVEWVAPGIGVGLALILALGAFLSDGARLATRVDTWAKQLQKGTT